MSSEDYMDVDSGQAGGDTINEALKSNADSGVRDTLNGCWILDKSQGEWSMKGYLQTMDVNELAIAAHEKGENENDTFHTIEMDQQRVKITKRSRVNADLVVDLPLGIEQVIHLPPGDRAKRSFAESQHMGHVQIKSSLHTVNGVANVTDIKMLERNVDGDPNKTRVVQTLTIQNEQTGKTHTTTRYFIPYLDTPPHLADAGNS
jgi:hypothetical protein